ncbi:tRNA preQ1(34) S-adenosylmethionine ribosyltransferase-isomerase QueA [Endomicrobium proavitum]|uniref:S-adenosylmethionine:tRNA ribosyltransferase-isomerase n=1 Tax=Endomicrobium proavitum TaxID=1408281 RepID=A0A0G3WJ72_9BACT|nr:tRNA preQ1(34) S-adenosylmethionine ribosyltransferase-isomerase QueA [Endomicrobium proavitum]AKL97932.1 S-adenosylmethionine:tRNA ribosyltransferase-isomerase [Endomicrobium proavitum]
MTQDKLLTNYDYDIPSELIAQKPADRRDSSRLFVVDRKSGKFRHRHFSDITAYFSEGDCLVINTTKVVPSRLFGKKATGGKVELLFLDPVAHSKENSYKVLMKPFLETGKKVFFDNGYECEIKHKTPRGEVVVEFNKADILSFLQKQGVMPLPPYINRKEGLALQLSNFDKERYQTVYAAQQGAIAAPTAGLHFTQEILNALKDKGVKIATLTLHVGWGTFKPIVSDEIDNHKMMSEKFSIDSQNAQKINAAKKENKKIFSVGTTSTRALETLANIFNGEIKEYSGETSIFIYPGYKFKIPDVLITNLHLPKSTPLMMASAFASRELMLKAYKEAVKEKYRFFSYGDSMIIL